MCSGMTSASMPMSQEVDQRHGVEPGAQAAIAPARGRRLIALLELGRHREQPRARLQRFFDIGAQVTLGRIAGYARGRPGSCGAGSVEDIFATIAASRSTRIYGSGSFPRISRRPREEKYVAAYLQQWR